MGLFRRGLEFAGRLLYPSSCSVCDSYLGGHQTLASLCYECWDKLDFCGSEACIRCGVPIDFIVGSGGMGGGMGGDMGGDMVCGDCMSSPPLFDGVRSVFYYELSIKTLLMRFKYGDRMDLRDLFGSWLCGRLGDWGDSFDYVVPVPLHYWRAVGRRYNQAMVLCQSMDFGERLVGDMLLRTRSTESMKRMSVRERYRNMRSAIALNSEWVGCLGGKSVLVIDDVMTSGATFSACSHALRRGGAEKICVASLARVIRQ